MIKRICLILVFTILASGMAAPQSRGGLRGYYNKEFKVGFRYPANWEFDDARKPVDDEPGFTLLAKVSPPESSFRGQLHQASATIAVGTIGESACRVFTPPNSAESTKPVREKIGTITFYKVSSGDVAPAPWGKPTPIERFMTAGVMRLT